LRAPASGAVWEKGRAPDAADAEDGLACELELMHLDDTQVKLDSLAVRECIPQSGGRGGTERRRRLKWTAAPAAANACRNRSAKVDSIGTWRPGYVRVIKTNKGGATDAGSASRVFSKERANALRPPFNGALHSG
jgi:hypothetical protein